MARVIGEYAGCQVEMVRDGKRAGWHYTVRPRHFASGTRRLADRPLFNEVGPFETSGAAYQDAVRRLTLLAAASVSDS